MKETDIYNAKIDLANLYFIIKSWISKDVTTIYSLLINCYIILLIQKLVNNIKDEQIKELIETKSLKDLIEYIKGFFDIIIKIKNNDENKNYDIHEFNPALEYELLLQKEEQTNRQHISIEYQFRLESEIYAQKIETLQEENALLLLQLVSNINIIINITINLGIYQKKN